MKHRLQGFISAYGFLELEVSDYTTGRQLSASRSRASPTSTMPNSFGIDPRKWLSVPALPCFSIQCVRWISLLYAHRLLIGKLLAFSSGGAPCYWYWYCFASSSRIQCSCPPRSTFLRNEAELEVVHRCADDELCLADWKRTSA